MKAVFTTKDGKLGKLDYPVIISQAMQHVDGFSLIGFNSWEDVQDEKVIAAVTDVQQFELTKDKEAVGFHENKN